MKISKLFHWLYTFLMFLPLLGLTYNFFGQMFSQSAFDVLTVYDVINFIPLLEPSSFGAYEIIYNVYGSLIYDVFVFGSDVFGDCIISLLSYWTFTTLVWIIFDVIIYVPNMIHKFIDKFSDKVGVL